MQTSMYIFNIIYKVIHFQQLSEKEGAGDLKLFWIQNIMKYIYTSHKNNARLQYNRFITKDRRVLYN